MNDYAIYSTELLRLSPEIGGFVGLFIVLSEGDRIT